MIYALIFFVLLLFRARHDRFGLDGWRVRRSHSDGYSGSG
jgi:hypothetical protein